MHPNNRKPGQQASKIAHPRGASAFYDVKSDCYRENSGAASAHQSDANTVPVRAFPHFPPPRCHDPRAAHQADSGGGVAARRRRGDCSADGMIPPPPRARDAVATRPGTSPAISWACRRPRHSTRGRKEEGASRSIVQARRAFSAPRGRHVFSHRTWTAGGSTAEGGEGGKPGTGRMCQVRFGTGAPDSTSFTFAASCFRPNGLGRKWRSSAFSSLRRKASSA